MDSHEQKFVKLSCMLTAPVIEGEQANEEMDTPTYVSPMKRILSGVDSRRYEDC